MNSPPDIDYAMVNGESIVWSSILECVVILGCAAGVAYCLFCVKCSSNDSQRQVDSRLLVDAHSNESQQGERGHHELVPTTVQPHVKQGLEGSGEHDRGNNNLNSIFNPPVFRHLSGWGGTGAQQKLYGENVWV